jgi:hypothetical protein
MLQNWIGTRLAEEHRRDLTPPRRTDTRWGDGAYHLAAPATPLRIHRTEATTPVGHMERRPIGHQVGTLLIRAGTRLGGATIRTS